LRHGGKNRGETLDPCSLTLALENSFTFAVDFFGISPSRRGFSRGIPKRLGGARPRRRAAERTRSDQARKVGTPFGRLAGVKFPRKRVVGVRQGKSDDGKAPERGRGGRRVGQPSQAGRAARVGVEVGALAKQRDPLPEVFETPPPQEGRRPGLFPRLLRWAVLFFP